MSDSQRHQSIDETERNVLYQALFSQAPWAGIVLNQDGSVVSLNEKAVGLLPLSDTPLFCDHFPGQEKDSICAWIKRVFRSDDEQVLETRLAGKGDDAQVRLIGKPVAGYPDLAFVSLQDLSGEQHNSRSLVQMAYYDQLTGLPNRYLLKDRLRWAISDAGRHREKMAILAIDLDHFKRINDTYGHQTGDEVLQRISRRMLSCLREADTLARIGGDEFTVLMQHVPDSQYAALVAERMLAVIRKPTVVMSVPQVLSASIGICLYPDDAVTEDELLERADIALYRSKSSGRNVYSFFNEHMKAESDDKIDFEHRLRQAIERNELTLHYQPIVSADYQHVIAMEALLRWDSAKDGLLPAAQFLPLAETIGLDRRFADWALHSAFRQMKTWIDAGLIDTFQPCKLTVNLSEQQLDSEALTSQIAQALKKSGLQPDRLILEVRESVLLRNRPQVRKNLDKLVDMSIQLYLDDFCHGFCTLGQIGKIPFSSIKIDQQLTGTFLNTQRGELLLTSMIQLAHHFGLQIIAEGVESQAAKEHLIRHGCDALQGFWISKPLPPVQAEMLLKLKKPV